MIPPRSLGRTGLEVSLLGLGGHTYPVGDGAHHFCTLDQRAALVARLCHAGVNYFDTTWFNELELLMDSFHRAGIGQDAVVSIQYVDGISNADWRAQLRRELESRLELMGIDRAPLFLMGVGNGRPDTSEITAACEAMARLKEEGLIQNIGLSCHEFAAFERIADVIESTNLPDYLMLRYNWKHTQASDRLFSVAQSHNVGVVLMKLLCWDCGPEAWDRRISVFEPVAAEGRQPSSAGMNAAQSSWLWGVQNSPCATTVPSINAMWEAEQFIIAAEKSQLPADTSLFEHYRNRLDDRSALLELSLHAESDAIRQRSGDLLKILP